VSGRITNGEATVGTGTCTSTAGATGGGILTTAMSTLNILAPGVFDKDSENL